MMNALVDLDIVLIVLVCGLLLWLIDHRVARIAIIVVAIFSLIISVLLSLVAGGPPHLRLSEMPWLMKV